jgi:hypothetical protein
MVRGRSFLGLRINECLVQSACPSRPLLPLHSPTHANLHAHIKSGRACNLAARAFWHFVVQGQAA